MTNRPLRILPAAVALSALLAPLRASAAITADTGYPQREHTTRALRADADDATRTGINAADCASDEKWSWTVTIPDGVTYSLLDVWASAENVSCAEPAARTGASPKCWRVAEFARDSVASHAEFSVTASSVVRAAFRKLGDADQTAFTTTAEVCTVDVDQQPTRFYLHFLLMSDANTVVGATSANEHEYVYDTVYDLHGPVPPTGLALGSGQSVLLATWNAQTTVKDFSGYKIYCYPKRGAEGDAGVAADAGAGCPAIPAELAGFAEGKIPDAAVEDLVCGTMSTTGSKITIDKLTDGLTYALAVAAIDKNDNTGALSTIACLAPQPTTDFYDAYRAGGGEAGGGFCNLGAPRGRTPLAGLFTALAASALLARRRARSSDAGRGGAR